VDHADRFYSCGGDSFNVNKITVLRYEESRNQTPN
jgi:hypothetical protein